MIREKVKMNMDIISAFAEGKTIQYKADTGSWHDLTENEGLPMGTLGEEPNNFRIKPESKYRPFANSEECWAEMLKHQPFGWVMSKKDKHYSLITSINDNNCRVYISGGNCFSSNTAMELYTFADGTPFGLKEEE